VLADEVDAAGCGVEAGLGGVGGEVEGGEFSGSLHGRLLSGGGSKAKAKMRGFFTAFRMTSEI
jgi:hypothetical protein